MAVQKPNFVVTQSCFITYIKVLDTSCIRRVSFDTVWELAKTKTDFHCKLSLPPFDSKFGKVAVLWFRGLFVVENNSELLLNCAWGIIVLWPAVLG